MKEPRFETVIFAAMALAAAFLIGMLVGCADPNNLPHRPLSQIDIQGHQPAGRAPDGDYCPGQYGYYLPSDRADEIFLFCWGSRS